MGRDARERHAVCPTPSPISTCHSALASPAFIVSCSEYFVTASALVFTCSPQIRFIGSRTHHLFALCPSLLPAEIGDWGFISETVLRITKSG